MNRLCPHCNRRVPVIYETDGEATRPGIDVVTIFDAHGCEEGDWMPVPTVSKPTNEAPAGEATSKPPPGYLKPGDRATQVRGVMLGRGPMTIQQVADDLGVTHRTVQQALNRLRKARRAHIVTRGKRGRPATWRLGPAPSATRSHILSLLKTRPRTCGELEVATSRTNGCITQHLCRLEREGLVSRSGRGVCGSPAVWSLA